MTFWNEEIETMPADELKKLQLKLLKNQIINVYSHSAFYQIGRASCRERV